MIPKAKDPRMDRDGAESASEQTVLLLPHEPTEAVEQVSLAGLPGRDRGGVSRLLVVALAVLGVAWVASLPRLMTYGDLMEDNLALRGRLQDIERRMMEADRMMMRLQLYDAQLQSLSRASGDHGPLPDSTMTNGNVAEPADQAGAGAAASEPLEVTAEMLSPSASWASGVAESVTAFIDMFQIGETDLDRLIAELESLRAVRDALPGVWPSTGLITSGFGWRSDPVHGTTKFHSGLDIANDRGTAIYAVAPGRVITSRTTSGYGRVIELDHGFGITTKYAHCTTLRVREGERVERGDYIATMGSTGKSTGPHLHFELRIDGSAHDPLKYLPR